MIKHHEKSFNQKMLKIERKIEKNEIYSANQIFMDDFFIINDYKNYY